MARKHIVERVCAQGLLVLALLPAAGLATPGAKPSSAPSRLGLCLPLATQTAGFTRGAVRAAGREVSVELVRRADHTRVRLRLYAARDGADMRRAWERTRALTGYTMPGYYGGTCVRGRAIHVVGDSDAERRSGVAGNEGLAIAGAVIEWPLNGTTYALREKDKRVVERLVQGCLGRMGGLGFTGPVGSYPGDSAAGYVPGRTAVAPAGPLDASDRALLSTLPGPAEMAGYRALGAAHVTRMPERRYGRGTVGPSRSAGFTCERASDGMMLMLDVGVADTPASAAAIMDVATFSPGGRMPTGNPSGKPIAEHTWQSPGPGSASAVGDYHLFALDGRAIVTVQLMRRRMKLADGRALPYGLTRADLLFAEGLVVRRLQALSRLGYTSRPR